MVNIRNKRGSPLKDVLYEKKPFFQGGGIIITIVLNSYKWIHSIFTFLLRQTKIFNL